MVQFSTSDDLDMVDGVETVTVAPRNPTRADIANVRAFMGTVRVQEIGGPLGISPSDVSFRLERSDLGGYTPKATDLIEQASGDVWTVLALTSAHQGNPRVLCRRKP